MLSFNACNVYGFDAYTILLLTHAQPSFPYDRCNLTDSTANLADGVPTLAQCKAAALYGTVDLWMQSGADSEGGPGGPGPPVRSYDNYKI